MLPKKRRKHDKTKKRKYVKSGRYKLDSPEEFVPDSWWRRYERDKRIVETTLAIIKEVGVRRFTVVELARRLNMHRSTIYYSYGCKAELLDYVTKQSKLCSAAGQFWQAIDERKRQADRQEQARLDRSAHMQSSAPDEPPDDRPEASGHPAGALEQDGAEVDDLPLILWSLRNIVVNVTKDLSVREGATVLSDLWLLARAERLRSIRTPSRFGRLLFGELPLTNQLEWAITPYVRGAKMAGELPAGTREELLVAWLVGLVWYHLAVRGPSSDLQTAEDTSAWDAFRLDYAVTCLLQGARQTVPPPEPPGGFVAA